MELILDFIKLVNCMNWLVEIPTTRPVDMGPVGGGGVLRLVGWAYVYVVEAPIAYVESNGATVGGVHGSSLSSSSSELSEVAAHYLEDL